MNKTSVVVGIIAVAALALSFLAFTKSGQTVVQQLGSVAGPDSSFPCESHNGITTCFERKPLVTATTTPCAFKSPAATSTLVRATGQITVASSTQTIWTIAKATTPYATTTVLVPDATLGSGALGSFGFFGTSTPAGGTQIFDPTYVIAPNQYVVMGVAGTVIADATKLKGFCSATFQQI